MKTFSTKCSCGYVMSVQANTRKEAVKMLQDQMNQAALDKHWEEYHQKPTLQQAHAMLEQLTVEGEQEGMPKMVS